MSNKTKQLLFRVSEKEFMQIQNNAKACGKTISAYGRETMLNMCVLDIDYSLITEHTDQISTLNRSIMQLIFTIRKLGNYTPADLEYILDTTNKILKLESEFIDICDKSVDSQKKTIARTVRNIVNKNIKK